MKSLVLFYSLTNGNTKRIAEMIKKEKNSDIEQIDTVIPYPDDYDTVVSQGQNVPSSMEVTFDSNGGDKLVTPIEDIIKEIKNF